MSETVQLTPRVLKSQWVVKEHTVPYLEEQQPQAQGLFRAAPKQPEEEIDEIHIIAAREQPSRGIKPDDRYMA